MYLSESQFINLRQKTYDSDKPIMRPISLIDVSPVTTDETTTTILAVVNKLVGEELEYHRASLRLRLSYNYIQEAGISIGTLDRFTYDGIEYKIRKKENEGRFYVQNLNGTLEEKYLAVFLYCIEV